MTASYEFSNLDRLAAKYAQKVIHSLVDNNASKDSTGVKKAASAADNTVTKALGVLQENGVYACFLYLLAKEKNNGGVVINEMLELLAELPFGWRRPTEDSPENVLRHISEHVTVDLERLLLAKETLEQMLIYARYGAKARG